MTRLLPRAIATDVWDVAVDLVDSDDGCWAVFGALVMCDPDLGSRAVRGALTALALGSAVGAPPTRARLAGYLLRDVGVLDVPGTVLSKPGPLTLDERDLVAVHPLRSERILTEADAERESIAIVRHHHERWDGSGYPDGLSLDAIPPAARIAAVADTYAALTSERPHRPAVSPTEAVLEVLAHAGTQFEPCVAAALAEVEADLPATVRSPSVWTRAHPALAERVREHADRASDLRGARREALFAAALGVTADEAASRLGRSLGTQRTWNASIRRALACPPRVSVQRFLAQLGRDVFTAVLPGTAMRVAG